MAKGSYCYQAFILNKSDKYADLRKEVKKAFNGSSSRYGYHRIHSVIKSAGTVISEKVIRRIMKEEQLIVPIIRRRKCNSYKGEISPEVANVINRDFHADKPNVKWLTEYNGISYPSRENISVSRN